MAFERIAVQFRRNVTLGMGVVACITILPMALLRFANDETWIGVLDLTIILVILLCMYAVLRGGDGQRIGLFNALWVSASAAALAVLDLDRGVMWIYAVIVANFMLTERRWAILISLLLTLSVLLRPSGFADTTSYFAFLMTVLMVGGFTAVFAWRTDLLSEQLASLAMRDPLTEASNRRALSARMDDATRRAGSGQAIGMLLMDLDHFKRINDTWGHERRDAVLCQFAQLVQKNSRSYDELFRLGGEEFVLLLPGTDLEGARRHAGHLLQVVHRELLVEGHPVTVSMGVSEWQPGETLAAWLARADALMYRAKRDGRDRAVCEDGNVLEAVAEAPAGAALA